MTNTAPITLEQLFRYYKHLPHQMSAVAELEQDLQTNGYGIAMRRDRPWFQTWSQAGKQLDYSIALKLIKQFEGCHLDAYADPLHGWDVATIGYGTTRYPDGRRVARGDRITVIEANELLEREVHLIANKLTATVPYWREMSAEQQAALLSFAYNLGASFYGAPNFETITARLREREWNKVPDALLLYRNPGTSVEAGLRRRREAEGRLWLQGMGLPPLQQAGANPLNVLWYSQRDSGTDQAARMCFSSSCAMLLEYLKPGTLKGPNGDDQYLKRVQQYGDTTASGAQLKALASYGITARFVQNADFTLIKQQIDRGVPVPLGFIHRGPVHHPTGGGHWLICIGHDAKGIIVHDPWGEADLISGGTVSSDGRAKRYSYQNFGRRWMVELVSGAYRYAPGKGWAVVTDSW